MRRFDSDLRLQYTPKILLLHWHNLLPAPLTRQSLVRGCYGESQRLANATTSGNSRTSATNFASNGELLSLRQTRASGRGNFKSLTGSTTTPSGRLQPAFSLTDPTPTPSI